MERLSQLAYGRDGIQTSGFFRAAQEAEHFTTTSTSPDEYAFSAWIPWK